MNRAASAVGALLLLTSGCGLLLAGCGTPEGSRDGYRGEAAITVQSAAGEVATTRITLIALLKNGIFTSSADDTITTSEQALSGMIGTFEALQPPPGADDLRDSASGVLTTAQDAVATARIATRRHDRGQLQDALNAVNVALDGLEKTHHRLAPGAPQ
jgi:hypothetical protein